jgi:hypothetical protein
MRTVVDFMNRARPMIRQPNRWMLVCLGTVVPVIAVSCSRPGVVLRSTSPDQSHVAIVRSHWALDPPKQSLWIADESEQDPVRLRTLGEDSEWCDQIVWKPDGSEVGFVLNGRRLLLYDAERDELVREVALIDRELVESGRVAKNVRFSAEGTGIEIEICPAAGDSPCLEARRVGL